MPRWGTVGSEQTHVRCANGFLRRVVSVSRRADDVGFNKTHTKEDWRNDWNAHETQRHFGSFPGSALEAFGWELLFWVNFVRNEGMGLDHTCASKVGHLSVNNS